MNPLFTLVDRALQARAEAGVPIRVGLIGAGYMGAAIARQIILYNPGLRLAAISNRTLANARAAYTDCGLQEPVQVGSVGKLEDAIAANRPAITDDAFLLCEAPSLEAIIEVTGDVEFGAQVALKAFSHSKHILVMNAELDATVGPILKVCADRAGVIYTEPDGDQPGVEANLFRYVKAIGLRPLVCGNIKGFQDVRRNPATQAAFAQKWNQKPQMVASFADGTKMSFEQATVANGVGFTVSRLGMSGWEFSRHIDELTSWYDVDELKALGGIVDYVVGAKPTPAVYVFACADDPKQRAYLQFYKLGPGPLYSFYTPYHLCHFEVPLSVARVVLFRDVILAPLGAPKVDVVATAKVALKAGQILDGIGGFLTYGQCEKAELAFQQRLLPMGLSHGCRVLRDIPADQVLAYGDVELPAPGVAALLRREQDRLFEPELAKPAPVAWQAQKKIA